MNRWVCSLPLGSLALGLACNEPEPDSTAAGLFGSPCQDADYAICGSPLPERDEAGQRWPSHSEDLLEICADSRFVETSLGHCEDGKRVLYRSWGFGVDTRFYAGEALVGRRLQSDLVIIFTSEPQCVCGGASFQGTLDSVYCRVARAEELCGRAGPSRIEGRTLGFEPLIEPGECRCEGPASP